MIGEDPAALATTIVSDHAKNSVRAWGAQDLSAVGRIGYQALDQHPDIGPLELGSSEIS